MRLLLLLLGTALATPNGFYHQEYNYRTSASSYKNNELQHSNDDQGYYSKDGDFEGRTRPRVNAHSQHSEYVNPKMQHGYRTATDRTSSYGQLNAGLADYNNYGPSDYAMSSNLREVTAGLQTQLEGDMQRAVFDHYRRATMYGGAVSQAQIETDRQHLEEELRRNMTLRLQDALKSQYGSQGVRGAYSYSIINGRLQPTANYNNQELDDLKSQMEENLRRQLNQQVQTQYRTTVNTQTHSTKNTYRMNDVGDSYGSSMQQQPMYTPYPEPQRMQPHPVAPIPDSITTVATRVQTELNEVLNKLLEDTQRRYFTENTYQAGANYDNILARLQDELKANITLHFDNEIKRTYGYSNYQAKYSGQDIENLRRQIETNLMTKLNRDFNRQRDKYYVVRPMFVVQPVPAHQAYYPSPVYTTPSAVGTMQYQSDINEMQQQLQEQMSRQLQTALMEHNYRQSHMYSGASTLNPQANYQATLNQLQAELNRNLTRQMDLLNAQYRNAHYQSGAYQTQLDNMRNQLQNDLSRQLQQGLQQSYSRYSSWSSSSSSSSNYRPVRGFASSGYQQIQGASNQMDEDCMQGDDPSAYRQQENDEDLTQKVQTHEELNQQTEEDDQDLTQQIQTHDELNQQSQDLTQQVQTQDELNQQPQDLTPTEIHNSLNIPRYSAQTSYVENLNQQTRADNVRLAQQTPYRTSPYGRWYNNENQQSQGSNQPSGNLAPTKPRYSTQNLLEPELNQQNQDLTQQTEDLAQQVQGNENLNEQSQDLTQQVQTQDELTQQTQNNDDLTQEVQTELPRSYRRRLIPSRRRLEKPESQNLNNEDLDQQSRLQHRPRLYQAPQQSVDFSQQVQAVEAQQQQHRAYATSSVGHRVQYYENLERERQTHNQQGWRQRPTNTYQTQQTQGLNQQTYDYEFPPLTLKPRPLYVENLNQQTREDNVRLAQQTPYRTSPYGRRYNNENQQIQGLNQQTGNLALTKPTYSTQNLLQPELNQQNQDLTQQTEDLTQQVQDIVTSDNLVQGNENQNQQSQDLTQQTQDLTQEEQTADLTQQSQDLTQQTEDLTESTNTFQQASSLYQQPEHLVPSAELNQQSQDLTQQNEDLTQQVQDFLNQQRQESSAQILEQQVQDLTGPSYQRQQDLTQQSEDLTQQTEDLIQQTQDILNQQRQESSAQIDDQLASNKIEKQTQDSNYQGQEGRTLTQQRQDSHLNNESEVEPTAVPAIIPDIERKNQQLTDLLRGHSQRHNIGPLDYQPQAVYTNVDGYNVPVGTTRQSSQDVQPTLYRQNQHNTDEDNTQGREPIGVTDNSIQTDTRNEEQQVDEDAEVTTKRPGFWSRLGKKFKNSIG